MFIKVKIDGKDNYFLKESIKEINETDNGFELLVLRNSVNSKGELSFGVLTFETNQIPVCLAGDLIGFMGRNESLKDFVDGRNGQLQMSSRKTFSERNVGASISVTKID
jgi:hypothetical protein